MNWFSRQPAIQEQEQETDSDRMRTIEAAYQTAKREHAKAAEAARTYQAVNRTPPPIFFHNLKGFVPVNREQRCDRVLDCLQNEAEHARQRFMAALKVRADYLDYLKRKGAIK